MYVLLCVVIVLIIRACYNISCAMRKQRRIEKIVMKNFPGPELKFFFGNALDFVGNKGILEVLLDYKSKFGDIVYTRVGPTANALIISDSHFMCAILQPRRNLTKGHVYTFTENWLGDGLLTAPAELWEKKRKLLTPAFDFHQLMDFISVFDKQCDILIEKLIDQAPVDSINIHSLISLCSLDIICETAMGVSIGAQRNQNMEYVGAVREMCRIIADRSRSVFKSMKPFYVLTEDYLSEKKCVEILHRYTDRVIEQKRTERKNKKPVVKKRQMINKRHISNLLEILLDYSDKEKGLSEKEIKDEVHTFMFAGHDTVTAAVSFFIYEIAKHVNVQDELYNEQQRIFGESEVNKAMQEEHIFQMKLLDLAIKESLRLYPPVPVFTRKVTNEFRYGQKFALWEMKVMLSKLIRQFEFRPAEPEHILDLRAEVVLTSKNGINVKVIRRQK
ncbi:cytochrome P450 4C1-like isoform X2 [Coccinella septempunctata]|uniref:cytochrome P450 4C1-like isoform X2 n=1 Tax=Coccinella septempunctata TaxID=41139 RepID=UPI001D083215|nr:cytochrome P450 4C1-like isoform X2 [Coccinella septempunctata]